MVTLTLTAIETKPGSAAANNYNSCNKKALMD